MLDLEYIGKHQNKKFWKIEIKDLHYQGFITQLLHMFDSSSFKCLDSEINQNDGPADKTPFIHTIFQCCNFEEFSEMLKYYYDNNEKGYMELKLLFSVS